VETNETESTDRAEPTDPGPAPGLGVGIVRGATSSPACPGCWAAARLFSPRPSALAAWAWRT
jgi:hypothetical protein